MSINSLKEIVKNNLIKSKNKTIYDFISEFKESKIIRKSLISKFATILKISDHIFKISEQQIKKEFSHWKHIILQNNKRIFMLTFAECKHWWWCVLNPKWNKNWAYDLKK